MIKTFNIWLEEKLEKRELIGQFLRNLGFDKHALEVQNDLNMRTKDEEDIIKAIVQLPISKDNQEEMIAFAKHHKESGFKALANLIKPNEAELQDTQSSSPAILPPSNQQMPLPPNKQQMAQQQQQPQMGF